jgi:hypothetical protein
MNTDTIEKHFGQIGARIDVRRAQPPRGQRGMWWSPPGEYSLDIERDRAGEQFVLTVPESIEFDVEFTILQAKPKQRHLLLMARRDQHSDIDRFLCGHDEREWFVAAVPGAVSTVSDAMESLKPLAVINAQSRAGLDARHRHRRKNKAFRRQGEWFFLPMDELEVEPAMVLRNEPIARSGGKPHMVAELYRSGGEHVHVCDRYPRGVSSKRRKEILRRRPRARSWNWKVMVRNSQVYARGDIRHPDHRTITLHGWHAVLMNTENQSRTMQHVAFLD